MPFFYREISADRVDEAERQAAAGAIAWAAADLELAQPVKVRWFEPGAELDLEDCLAGLGWLQQRVDIAGLFDGHRPGEVWLRSGRGAIPTAKTALHECMHLLQFQLAAGSTGAIEHDGREAMSQRYAADLAEIAAAMVAARPPHIGEGHA